MRCIDSRRLTGPNLLTTEPAALLELELDADTASRAIAVLIGEVERAFAALGRAKPRIAVRQWAGGAALAVHGELDALLPLTLLNDWAADSAAEILAGHPPLRVDRLVRDLEQELETSRNPALVALHAEARRRGVPCLWDDETVSVGTGRGTLCWPVEGAPAPEDVPWPTLGRVPVALVTGSNGKTTSARLLARIVRCAGLVPGCASTEEVFIGERLLASGDWTGPEAARLVLRHPEVELAVLETARGGILRRGLAIDVADGALITNVGLDHIGAYGVHDRATMARAKAVVGSVVRPDGCVVVNGGDEALLDIVPMLAARVVLFASDPSTPGLVAHLAGGGEAWFVRDGVLVQARDGFERPVVGVAEVPITFGGAALHNVENALGVAALAAGLGLPHDAIVAGLRSFSSDAADNPGRANLYAVDDVRVLIDFGHNREGVEALLTFVQRLRREASGRLVAIVGGPGDRSDDDLRQVAGALRGAVPDRVWLRELSEYMRGRAAGEVPSLIRAELERLGQASTSIVTVASETAALRGALDEARAGDFIVVFPHVESEVDELLAARGARPLTAA